jgi:hypothetical protein
MARLRQLRRSLNTDTGQAPPTSPPAAGETAPPGGKRGAARGVLIASGAGA